MSWAWIRQNLRARPNQKVPPGPSQEGETGPQNQVQKSSRQKVSGCAKVCAQEGLPTIPQESLHKRPHPGAKENIQESLRSHSKGSLHQNTSNHSKGGM